MKETFIPNRVCLITNEIFPFAPGGIGRLVSNWIIQNSEINAAKISILFQSNLKIHAKQISEYCAQFDVECFFCGDRGDRNSKQENLIDAAPQIQWNFLHAYKTGYEYFCYLRYLEQNSIVFDIIEFPDYGGWAAASIEAKRCRLALLNSRIAVRLHSTFGMILEAEKYYHQPSGWSAAMIDLEKFSLKHADIVIGHIYAIAKMNQEYYKFSKDWLSDVIIETPPIYVEDKKYHYAENVRVNKSKFVFSSRFQPFKRADLFIKAACLFFEQEFDGEALLVSYGWDQNYIDTLEILIPDKFKHKIRIMTGLSQSERQSILSDAIVVIPSDYESYCLFAYESALQGNALLLRRSCEAFGNHSVWKDGYNCLLFGDSPRELMETMVVASSWHPKSTTVTNADIPYWAQQDHNHDVPKIVENSLTERVSLLLVFHDVHNLDRFEYALNFCMNDICSSALIITNFDTYKSIELPKDINKKVKVVKSCFGIPQFDDVIQAALATSEEFITIADARDNQSSLFNKICLNVAASDNNVDVITCNDSIKENFSESSSSIEFAAGEHLSSILTGMLPVGRLVFLRASIFKEINYDYSIGCYGKRKYFIEMLSKNKNIYVIPDVLNECFSYTNVDNTKLSTVTEANILREFDDLFYKFNGLPIEQVDVGGVYQKMIVQGVDAATAIQRIHPRATQWWGDPVGFSKENNGWLIHPIDKDVVIARIHLDSRMSNCNSYFVNIINIGENNGVVVGLIAISDEFKSTQDVESLLELENKFGSKKYLVAGQSTNINLSVIGRDRVSDLCIISRAPPGYSSNDCRVFLLSYGAYIN